MVEPVGANRASVGILYNSKERRIEMGCYDTVAVPCPTCGKKYYAQSKGGDCRLDTYDIKDAPPDVMSDINRHAPFQCDFCDTLFQVDTKFVVYYTVKAIEGTTDEEEDEDNRRIT